MIQPYRFNTVERERYIFSYLSKQNFKDLAEDSDGNLISESADQKKFFNFIVYS